jgi:DNA-directed RNA polymerase subunit RPC12/RpoP
MYTYRLLLGVILGILLYFIVRFTRIKTVKCIYCGSKKLRVLHKSKYDYDNSVDIIYRCRSCGAKFTITYRK